MKADYLFAALNLNRKKEVPEKDTFYGA